MYLTYDEYLTRGGTLDPAAFEQLCEFAGIMIDFYTFGRLKGMVTSDPVKRCAMGLIGVAAKRINVTERPIVSGESNDGVSKSYSVPSVKDALDICDSEMMRIIRLHLLHETASDGTPLLYRGCV